MIWVDKAWSQYRTDHPEANNPDARAAFFAGTLAVEPTLPDTEGSVVRDGGHIGRVFVLWDGKWCASYGGAKYDEAGLLAICDPVILYVEPRPEDMK